MSSYEPSMTTTPLGSGAWAAGHGTLSRPFTVCPCAAASAAMARPNRPQTPVTNSFMTLHRVAEVAFESDKTNDRMIVAPVLQFKLVRVIEAKVARSKRTV